MVLYKDYSGDPHTLTLYFPLGGFLTLSLYYSFLDSSESSEFSEELPPGLER